MKRLALGSSALLALAACAGQQRAAKPGPERASAAVFVPPPAASKDAGSDTPVEEEAPAPEPGPALIRVEASDIPTEARSLEEFVPSGWKLAQSVRGDLGGSEAPDAVLVLVRLPLPEDAPPLSDEDLYRDRVLLVLLAEFEGDFRRVGFSNELLACTQCGGAFWASIEMPVEVEIADKQIRVAQEYGARVVTSIETYFRYEVAGDRVRLVRRVDQDRDRAAGGVVTVEVDYDAGTRAESEQGPNGSKRKIETFPRTDVFLEQVKLSESP